MVKLPPIFVCDTMTGIRTDGQTNALPLGEYSKSAQSSVSRFMQAANGMRYNAPHQVGNMAMLKSPSEDSFSGLPSNIQTRGPDGNRARMTPLWNQKR